MIKNIQAMRGIAVMLVLLAHLTKIEEKYFSGVRLLPEFLSIGISGVDLFFVISGFVMLYVTRSSGAGWRIAGEFLMHRVARIYPLYWLVSLAVLVIFLVHPTWVNSSQGSQVDLLASFLLLPLPQGQFPLLGVGWSLIHEMYFYLVFGFLLLIPDRFRRLMLFAWFCFVSFFFFLGVLPSVPFLQLVLHPLTLEFILGCAIALIFLAGRGGGFRIAIYVGLIGWSVGYGVYAHFIGHGMASVEWWRPVVFGIPASLICYGLALQERDTGKNLPEWLVRIGDWSYSIYLSHLLVISALGRFWRGTGFSGDVPNFLALIFIFGSAIGAGALSYRWLEKPLHQSLRRLVASRN